MMTDVAKKLKTSGAPIIKKIHEENGTTITAIGLKRGVELTEHEALCPSRLLVIKGEIDFNTAEESRRYACYESYEIPMFTKHNVVAWDDAIILLFQKKA